MDSRVARALALAAMGLLLISLLPSAAPEPFRTLGAAARAPLQALGVVPGVSVFEGSPGAWKIEAECVAVTGSTPDGDTVELHRSPCPPEGFQWAHDPFESLVQGTVRNAAVANWVRAPAALPEDLGVVPEDARKLLQLGDYFCHSPLAGGPRERVTLVRQQRQRNIRSGARAVHTLRCRFACEPRRLVVPRCELGAPVAAAGERRGA